MAKILCPNCSSICRIHTTADAQRTVCPGCGFVLSQTLFSESSTEVIAPLEKEIRAKCEEMADFLTEKNKAYGNSAAEPVGIFAKRLDTLAQIDTRIDDKLNRLMKGSEYPGDDTIKNLAGYLILRMIVKEQINE